MDWLVVLLLGLAAYLIGSIPPAYYLVLLKKNVDIREVGSKNVGTLNTYHQVGIWGAGLVLLFDLGKGALAVLLPGWVGAPDWAVYVTGIMVVAGHNWPVLLRFRGGKGAASILGVFLAFVPLPTLIALVPGVITLLLSRNAILGLAVGYILTNLLVIVAVVFDLNALLPNPGIHHMGLCLLLSVLVTTAYAISIRAQIINALRTRRYREIFYGA